MKHEQTFLGETSLFRRRRRSPIHRRRQLNHHSENQILLSRQLLVWIYNETTVVERCEKKATYTISEVRESETVNVCCEDDNKIMGGLVWERENPKKNVLSIRLVHKDSSSIRFEHHLHCSLYTLKNTIIVGRVVVRWVGGARKMEDDGLEV